MAAGDGFGGGGGRSVGSSDPQGYLSYNAVDLDNWAANGFYSPYWTGDLVQRTVDSGYIDVKNAELQSAYDRMYNYYMTRLANEFTAGENEKGRLHNAEQAQLQRDWEERMSNTAYERSYDQLRKLGLNPYLMASGAAASTPSGSAGFSSGSGSGVAGSAYSSFARSHAGLNDLIKTVGQIALNAFNLAKKKEPVYNTYNTTYRNTTYR